MIVKVEYHIKQVEKGALYSGYIRIGFLQLDYKIRFAIPIPQLEELVSRDDDRPELRQLFRLEMKMGKVITDLNDEEFTCFVNIVIEFILDFYKNTENHFNENPMVATSKTCSGLCEFSPIFYKILNSPKFGYPLAY